ncbi:MAG TPA: phosphoglycerate kinase [Hyphomicrobiales bacterium]|nr:phosphoglycerate kinase [Hyphomicrobiales bacterium]
MTAIKTLDDIGDVAGKRVLVRVDINVPMEDGEVGDDSRIRAVLPTIRELADKGARVVLLAHFGRPKGRPDPKLSLRPLAAPLAERLGRPVGFAPDCVGPPAEEAVAALKDGEVLLLENTRFHAEEEKNDPAFAKRLAALGDLYVDDAFSAAHRAHASTEGVARLLPAFAGRCMERELDHLERALERPERPVLAIVGGAKVSTKLDLLGNLVKKVQALAIGGAMANTFLAAGGVEIGRSLYESELLDTAQDILAEAERAGCRIILPVDAELATELARGVPHRTADLDEIDSDEMILDIGPKSVTLIEQALKAARTLMWNGPVGAFEVPPYDRATVAIARAAAAETRAGRLVSVAGGGDTVAALAAAGVTGDLTYVSTAGGAFLEWIEGKALPGVEVLRR